MWFISLALIFLAALLRFAAFPPFSISEAAFICLIPLVFLSNQPHRPRLAFLFGWLAGFLFWAGSLFWLRHVTAGGWLSVCGLLALFDGLWVYLLRRSRDSLRAGGYSAFRAALALAAGWAFFEWVRTWFLFGFPWNPLALALWNRPATLSAAPVIGAGGLSFFIVLVNLGLVQTFMLMQRWKWPREKGRLPFFFPLAPGLGLGLAALLVPAVSFVYQTAPETPQTSYRIGFIQPYADQKWEQETAQETFRVLTELTLQAAAESPDFILWPEAATPWPIVGNPYLREAVEQLVRSARVPIIMGNLAWYPDSDTFHNGIFVVSPDGLAPRYYAKRKLVPMGEFVPFRRFLPNVETIVPIGGDTTPGDQPEVLELPLAAGRTLRAGALVCYEDIFPHLARQTAALRPDFLLVVTNNAWYGEEWGAEQHAAHSVLRAAENRLPVLRVGNGGWSGWIDQRGVVRHRVANEAGSIFFRGYQMADILLLPPASPSFYTRHGQWWPMIFGSVFVLGICHRRLSFSWPAGHGNADGCDSRSRPG